MILRLSFLSLVFSSYLFAISVFVTKEAIKYEEKIDISKLEQKEFDTIPRTCTPLTLEDLQNGEFITTHHINKNSIVCQKSVRSTENNEIIFNFGGVKIVKKGKIIYENEEFIRFKNLDGTIEQIYKDGRQK